MVMFANPAHSMPDADDTVITDISMPRADGHAVLQRVRSTTPEVPVIMMTAVATELGDAVDAIKCGAFDYIQKVKARSKIGMKRKSAKC